MAAAGRFECMNNGMNQMRENTDKRGRCTLPSNPLQAVIMRKSWHVIMYNHQEGKLLHSSLWLALCVGPVLPPRGRFWRRFIISNGSGSHNGGTLSDLSGMHCGRHGGPFDLHAYVHRSVPCQKTDPLADISLPLPSQDPSLSLLQKLKDKNLKIIKYCLELT